MKASALLFALFASVSVAHAQSPTKGDNVIKIQTSDSTRTALKKLAAVLTQHGYTVEKLDTEFNTLRTNPKNIEGRWIKPQLTLSVFATPGANATLSISGASVANLDGAVSYAMKYMEGANRPERMCFLDASSVAQAYPNGKVSYGKKD
jgi:hypothetical protein